MGSNDKCDKCESLLARTFVLEERVKALVGKVDERDRLYLEKFRASEIAVAAAITASDKQTTASFASSEKAIMKAEEAQREYNVRSNEFRGQLDDQVKTLMPRTESQTLFKSYEDKLEDIKKDIVILRDQATSAVGIFVTRDAYQREHTSLRESMDTRLKTLEAANNSNTGSSDRAGKDLAQRNWNIGTVIAILFGLTAVMFEVIRTSLGK
jgi:nitrogen regulatory protein PII-like uncharacterized protein